MAYIDRAIAELALELAEEAKHKQMIVHGSNCGCPNVLVHVSMLPGGLKSARYVRVCQIEGKPEATFWTEERKAILRILEAQT